MEQQQQNDFIDPCTLLSSKTLYLFQSIYLFLRLLVAAAAAALLKIFEWGWWIYCSSMNNAASYSRGHPSKKAYYTKKIYLTFLTGWSDYVPVKYLLPQEVNSMLPMTTKKSKFHVQKFNQSRADPEDTINNSVMQLKPLSWFHHVHLQHKRKPYQFWKMGRQIWRNK